MMRSMDECNLYELLQVSKDASKVAIQEAYVASQSLFNHDSMVSHNFFSDPERDNILNRLQEAYQTLMDDQKRIEYDKRTFNRVGKWYVPAREGTVALTAAPAGPGIRRPHERVRIEDYVGEDGLVSLRRMREAVGTSLEDLSAATKIRVPLVLALESRDLAKLPPAIYIKGYLRSYAETLGADPEELVRAYGPLGNFRP